MAETENDLIGTADRLTRIARALRELSDELEVACNDLLADAVERDTIRDKDQWRLRKAE